jgi:hypothetical protein
MEIKFIRKFAMIMMLAAIVCMMLNFIVYRNLLPLHFLWGSERLYHKEQFLKKNDYNTVFIGASQVMQQINPQIFDSIVSPALQTKTFNMGENWFSASELYHALNLITANDSLKLKYIFIELTKIKRPDLFNLNKPRVYYWYTYNDYKFTVNATLDSRYSIIYKAATIAAHTLGYFDNLIALGYGTEALTFNNVTRNNNNGMALGPYGNGYLIPHYNSTEPADVQLKRIAEKPNPFLKDSSAITSKRKISEQEFLKFEKTNSLPEKYNKYYVNFLTEMIETYQRKGIKIIYFVPIRLDRNHYEEILPVFKSLPETNKMEVSNANLYPDLYMASTSYDVTHMNVEGAKIYSGYLAKKFLSSPQLH